MAIEAYLKEHENKDMLRFLTCGSVDDGKSTLIGRMLYDSKMIFDDQLAAAESESKSVLVLYINVNENARQGVYQIPCVLKDNANHNWNFILSISIENPLPEKYDLFQNYPNPFNSITQLKYSLTSKQEQQIQLIIFDLLGRDVRSLVDEKQSAGIYTVVWDGKDNEGKQVSSGVYFYRIISGSFVKIRKMLLLD